jgi:phosphatidylserine/phosphatidylglycerophosphate/cardiolipin synthase-like enzyme
LNELIEYLRNSLADDYFSKAEKRSFKDLISHYRPDPHQLNVIRSKIYELANEKVRDDNYRFILEWVKEATGALQQLQVHTPPQLAAFFSPGDACRNAIIQQINRAVSRLQICVFTISDDTIANAILTSHRKGVNIQIITDNEKSEDEGSDINRLARQGIPVKTDTTPNHMHHKFMVADEQTVLTGSYNWTHSAAKYNHENILLTNNTATVRSYLKEFEQLWKVMTVYS